ncbi:hypothetical protein PR1_141 [Providencia phage vB_PreS_PR1]|uniref:Tape measure chaperone n=1 Tax=Providencia phage vB_PreS_PR1 TaxID=1931407 RepID=A0A1S6KV13_9CAUD|nr:hypothetical protein FDH30_gp073 [Providencia phage vB_PreS_PR1]AQT25283.1 hypothetical protein PR1_141 [Providencia phage vB_PreS_PR1]
MIDLKKVALETKEAEVEYLGIPGFIIRVRHVSRTRSQEILEKCQVPQMENGMIVGYEQDDAKFVKELASAAVVGWKGLTVEGVEKLMLVDLVDQDPDTIVEYSPDNAEQLLKSSRSFLTFINETVFRIDSFRTKRS